MERVFAFLLRKKVPRQTEGEPVRRGRRPRFSSRAVCGHRPAAPSYLYQRPFNPCLATL